MKRLVFLLLAAMAALSATDCSAQVLNFRLGNPGARITVVEYASITCPHCRDWDAYAMPELSSRYFQTGIAQYELREDLSDPVPEMGERGYIVARCAASNRGYFHVVHALMSTMPLVTDPGGIAWLVAGGEAGGLSQTQVFSCLNDRRNWDAFDARHNVNATMLDSIGRSLNMQLGLPAVFVNGRLVNVDPRDPAAVEQAIEQAERDQ